MAADLPRRADPATPQGQPGGLAEGLARLQLSFPPSPASAGAGAGG